MACIVSINRSDNKGTVKIPEQTGTLAVDGGLLGDAHAHDGHRQLSLLASESYEKMYSLGAEKLEYGAFAENITTEGMVLHILPVGTHLKIGECEIEITQIGKECHQGCEIAKKIGKCVMPLEGVFAVVIRSGEIHLGDSIEIIHMQLENESQTP